MEILMVNKIWFDVLFITVSNILATSNPSPKGRLGGAILID